MGHRLQGQAAIECYNNCCHFYCAVRCPTVVVNWFVIAEILEEAASA